MQFHCSVRNNPCVVESTSQESFAWECQPEELRSTWPRRSITWPHLLPDSLSFSLPRYLRFPTRNCGRDFQDPTSGRPRRNHEVEFQMQRMQNARTLSLYLSLARNGILSVVETGLPFGVFPMYGTLRTPNLLNKSSGWERKLRFFFFF